MILITESEKVGKIESAPVFQITDVKFVALGSLEGVQQLLLNGYVEYLTEMLKNGFFYSPSYDLTNSAQRSIKKKAGGMWTDTYDLRYVWNYPGCTELLVQSISLAWVTPVIQGYVGIKEFEGKGGKGQVVLISRRRHAKAGLRYIARGVDEAGNVANFVETEQMVYKEKLVSSFVQIRGSVPLFWQQSGVSNELVFTKSLIHSKDPLALHYGNIMDEYGSTVTLNLLNQAKPNEQKLISAYEPLLADFQEMQGSNQFLKYIYFNYHKRCPKHNLAELNALFHKWRRVIALFGYYKAGARLQKGVFRTNCLDCLDRTNVVQGSLGIYVMKQQLADIETDYSSKIDQKLKELWADNGDYISIQYSGDKSVISEVMRNGQEGFFGKLSHVKCSVNRLFKGWLDDDFGQEAVDLFLSKEPFCAKGKGSDERRREVRGDAAGAHFRVQHRQRTDRVHRQLERRRSQARQTPRTQRLAAEL